MRDSFRLGRDGIYRCDDLQEFIWQKHGFGTREASPTAALTLHQIHSASVFNAGVVKDRDREGDALVTDDVGVTIGVRTADCVPVLILDGRTRAVAAVHAGWRGTAAAIIKRTIEKMSQDFDTNPADIYAAIGPCIRACCYEVGPEVMKHFVALFPEYEETLGKWNLDLPEANRRQLLEAGVSADRVFDSGLCTSCQSESFYSYRREPDKPGRMTSFICRLS